MSSRTTLAAASIVAVGLIGGGTAIANAATNTASSGNSTSSSSSSNTASSASQRGHWGGKHRGTPVTGTELAKIKAAVDAKYPGVSVDKAFKDAKGGYVAVGTKNGKREFFTVSSDLKTVTERTFDGHRGGHGHHGEHRGTPVTGAALTKLTAAIAAKYPGVTIKRADQLKDGSYVAMGTKSGKPVFFKVSKDLKTITEATGFGGHHGHHHGGDQHKSA